MISRARVQRSGPQRTWQTGSFIWAFPSSSPSSRVTNFFSFFFFSLALLSCSYDLPFWCAEHEISGEALLELDHETFKEMGVKSIGKRVKILNMVAIAIEQEPLLQDEIKGLPSVLSSDVSCCFLIRLDNFFNFSF